MKILQVFGHILLYSIYLVNVECAQEDRCTTCTKIADRFQMGLVKTSKSNFGGGNSHWEENKLGRYEFSETRFLEVMEVVCEGADKQCHSMLEELEETFERWWKKYYSLQVKSDLRDFMCVRKLKACCARGTYGPSCEECRGGKKNPCGGNGACQGDGTKSGTGECVCEPGYEGDMCQKCAIGYHASSTSEQGSQLHCKACHISCKGACDGEGASRCEKCKDGWVWVPEVGCTDIDECEDETMCKNSEVCVNLEGSHQCMPCDKSCVSCRGPSNLNCTSCSRGFYMSHQRSCLPCHESCGGFCSDDSPHTCDQCRRGWLMTQHGCVDEDECVKASSCEADEYCINTVGSFKCSTCYPSCDGCYGSGSDKCKRCKKGFKMENGVCVDVDECEGGACSGLNKRCINTPGSFICECVVGFVPNSESVCVPNVSGGPMGRRLPPEGSKNNEYKKEILNKQQKMSDKQSKKKKKKVVKEDNYELLYYILSLSLFAALCWFSSSFVTIQALLTSAFSVYLYMHASYLDENLKNNA